MTWRTGFMYIINISTCAVSINRRQSKNLSICLLIIKYLYVCRRRACVDLRAENGGH